MQTTIWEFEPRQTIRALENIGVTDWRDTFEQADEDDFTVSNYRFIADDAIDEIMQEELLSDEYMLGCFNAWFIADILGMPTDAVEKIQKADAYEGLGALMAQHIQDVQEKYASADGYGHHFARYDGEEQEITIGEKEYHVFRVN